MRLLIGAYLFFLAFRLWRKGSSSKNTAREVGARDAFVTTLLNPKAVVIAALTPLSRPEVWIALAGFVAIAGATAASWMAIGAAMGGAARSGGRASLIPRIGSAVVVIFAGLIVYPAL